MKVDGPKNTSGAKGVSKTDKKKSAGGGFDTLIGDTAGTGGSAATSRPASVQALDALLTLQDADGATSEEARRRARQRAADLLDHLDKIRMGLLTGELPKSTIRQLAHTIATHRAQVMDPKLAEILDEIDLRAQVELAKFG